MLLYTPQEGASTVIITGTTGLGRDLAELCLGRWHRSASTRIHPGVIGDSPCGAGKPEGVLNPIAERARPLGRLVWMRKL